MPIQDIARFTQKDVIIKEVKTLYKGFLQLEKITLQYQCFAGHLSPEFERELLRRSDAAAAILYDPHLHKIVLIEQFRMGAMLNSQESPWLFEIIAGLISHNETPEAVIKREAFEEAGATIEKLIPISTYWTSPGASNERVYLFCGKIDASNIGGIHGLKDENEDIRVHLVEPKEAYDAIASGLICNSSSIIAIQWLQIYETQVRQQWLEGN
ncbi:MAG: ADP-ribose pyrophosphatase [Legionellaceae bacterium]